MKKTLLAALILLTIVSLSFTGATKKNLSSTAKKTLVKVTGKQSKKTTYVYASVGYVGEAPGGGQFIGWVELSDPICEDIDIEFHYMVYSLQYHSITIPASQTYAEDRWGSCPPAYSSENVGVSSVSRSTSCDNTITILY